MKNLIRLCHGCLSVSIIITLFLGISCEIYGQTQNKMIQIKFKGKDMAIYFIESSEADFLYGSKQIIQLDKNWKKYKVIIQEPTPIYYVNYIDGVLNYILLTKDGWLWKKKNVSNSSKVLDEKSVLLPTFTLHETSLHHTYAVVSNNTFIDIYSDTILIFNRDNYAIKKKKLEIAYDRNSRLAVDTQNAALYFLSSHAKRGDSLFTQVIRTDGETFVSKKVLMKQIPFPMYPTTSSSYLTPEGNIFVQKCTNCGTTSVEGNNGVRMYSMVKIDMANDSVNVYYCKLEYIHEMNVLSITDNYVYFEKFIIDKNRGEYVLSLEAQDMNIYKDKWIKY